MVREVTTPGLAFRSIGGGGDSDDTNIGLDENELDEEIGTDEDEGLESAEDEEGPPQTSEE